MMKRRSTKYAKQAKVKKAIDRGLQNLADCQTADGRFLYYFGNIVR